MEGKQIALRHSQAGMKMKTNEPHPENLFFLLRFFFASCFNAREIFMNIIFNSSLDFFCFWKLSSLYTFFKRWETEKYCTFFALKASKKKFVLKIIRSKILK